MSSLSEWFRKLGHRLRKTQVPDKFLLPQLAGNLESADARLFKKLVQKGRLAPFYPGRDEQNSDGDLVECPICCMLYGVMNKTRCCGQRICSECIVQIRIGCPFSGCSCPFCKKSGFDVDICEGKTEIEKREDLLEEQRFEECRLRQIAEATACSYPVPTDGEEEENDGAHVQDASAVASESPPANNQSDAPSQDTQTANAEPTEGNASSSRFNLPPPRSLRDEYRQEFAAMTHRTTVSNLSYSELQQCEDYLGVCPEDLGLRLEEFNDLLLEQTLISSMIEMRKAERRQEKEQARRTETAQDLGASSSVAPAEGEADLDSGPSLRSHSLPHPILHEDDSSPGRQSEGGHRWSFENVLRTVSNSTPFAFLTSLTTGEPSTSSAPELSSPFYSEEVQETAREDADREEHRTSIEESDSSTDSSHTSTDVWKNLLNSLAGFDSIHAQFRMITVRFDDPLVDATVNGNARQTRELEAIEMTRRSSDAEAEAPQHITEEIPMTEERVTKTVAVENPDGSLALISVPNEEVPSTPNAQERVTETAGEDRAVVTATQTADRSQIDAIAEADARLRQLYSQLS